MPERTARLPYEGTVPTDLMARHSGAEVLGRLLRKELPASAMSAVIPFELVEVEVGRVVFSSMPAARFHNTMGIVHGGYAMTLLDTCMGVAIYSKLPAGIGYTTIETKVNFTRPIRETDGPLHAVGTALHVGTRTGTAEGRLLGADGALYAHGTTTCFLFPLDGDGRVPEPSATGTPR